MNKNRDEEKFTCEGETDPNKWIVDWKISSWAFFPQVGDLVEFGYENKIKTIYVVLQPLMENTAEIREGHVPELRFSGLLLTNPLKQDFQMKKFSNLLWTHMTNAENIADPPTANIHPNNRWRLLERIPLKL